MMRIGELADIAGVTTRAVRHYHAVGLLPEPERRPNGYREYGSRDLVRLLRIIRLIELDLSLDEARDALADDSGRELRDILLEIAADLDAQQVALEQRRKRIAQALTRDRDLAASPTMSVLLDRLRGVLTDPAVFDRERDLLEIVEGSMPSGCFGELAEGYQKALDDPSVVAAAQDFSHRFAALTDQRADDPEVIAIATELVAQGTKAFPQQAASATDTMPGADRGWAVFLQSLTPAQRHCVQLASAQWTAAPPSRQDKS